MNDIDFTEIRALLDKQAITETLMRYSRGIDRKDSDVLRDQVYWPDATDDHVLYEGDLPGLVEFCEKFTQNMPTMHFLGNILVDLLDSTHAFSETYYMAYHHMPDGAGRTDLMLGGRYLDKFEKRGAEWRLSHRTVVIDWYTRNPGTSEWATGLFANLRNRGAPKPSDPLYRLHPAGLNA